VLLELWAAEYDALPRLMRPSRGYCTAARSWRCSPICVRLSSIRAGWRSTPAGDRSRLDIMIRELTGDIYFGQLRGRRQTPRAHRNHAQPGAHSRDSARDSASATRLFSTSGKSDATAGPTCSAPAYCGEKW
jgi:hypothetical protein